jgi:hypothetical protein
MKTKTLTNILRLSSIILLILNALIFIYCIALMMDNNIFSILLFLVFVTISIVNIHISKDFSEMAIDSCRTFMDFMFQEYKNIKSLLNNGTINEAEAHNRINKIQETNDSYGCLYGCSRILFRINVTIFLLPIILILQFSNINILILNNCIIYSIIFGIISQILMLVFLKILDHKFLNTYISECFYKNNFA